MPHPVVYNVSNLWFDEEGDFLFGAKVIVLPIQQQHVGAELIPVHVAITRRVQLVNNSSLVI